jgi:uncharacterized protein (TIGR02271 family)
MSSPKKNADIVVGLFNEQPPAELAIQRLKAAGFSENQIGVVMQDRDSQQQLADSTGTKVAETAATGAIGGGVAGGVLGLLAGIGALAIPGIGPIIAGGALASTLAGAGIGAAAGGLLGALVGMGVPEEDARYFEEGLRSGGVLVTVQAGARAQEARQILLGAGADLEARSSTSFAAEKTSSDQGTQRLELREEELRTEKEQVQAGEVRLRKDVVTEKRTVEVPVTREEVVIERHPVTGRTPADQEIGEDEEIRIPVMEEQVRVEKTPVVKEEVTLGKRRVQETQKVSETVRREEARIEETGDANLTTHGQDSDSWRGNERRYRDDESYAGPERRVAEI